MRRLSLVMAALLGTLVLTGAAWVLRARHAESRPLALGLTTLGVPRAPQGERVRVQVLNTTRSHGLARRATRLLRDRGFDVVEMGNSGPLLDTTLVLDRSGHPAWAAAVARVLTPSRTEARPDSSRYLDVTVLLGRTWRPPREPFDP